jgi:hypothetical protein
MMLGQMSGFAADSPENFSVAVRLPGSMQNTRAGIPDVCSEKQVPKDEDWIRFALVSVPYAPLIGWGIAGD